MANHVRRVVFFDLDGTLHQQDLFGAFLRYLLRRLPLNALLVLPLLPIIGAAMLVKGRAARWPVSVLLWACTFCRRETTLKALEASFIVRFRAAVTPFPAVQQRLDSYLQHQDIDVWLITGSPQTLVERAYADARWMTQVNLIGSQMRRAFGGRVLSVRCLGREKVVQLEQRLGAPLRLYSGYSDSKQDNPLLFFCEHRWRVTSHGELEQLE
ncbi:phosphatidylglycerophosphatase C [Kluyvera ascorbata]|uniref:phosphatidylglycerophosphatase C n=1 Tax=Kluyvera ascorbata TaxID=51288 RepID=UPI0035CCE76D